MRTLTLSFPVCFLDFRVKLFALPLKQRLVVPVLLLSVFDQRIGDLHRDNPFYDNIKLFSLLFIPDDFLRRIALKELHLINDVSLFIFLQILPLLKISINSH